MKCPHCLVEINEKLAYKYLGQDSDGQWGLGQMLCPNGKCNRLILLLYEANWVRSDEGNYLPIDIKHQYLVWPKGVSRAPLGPQVPKELAEDYNEACVVLSESPKASAALSRRCLQNLLRGVEKVEQQDLAHEIQEVLDLGKLPSYLATSLDAIRNIGNFAAHPIKSKSSGQIVDVEPGEAEWNLEVLERLFDFYFVQPGLLKMRRDALNRKLKDAGKPPMK